MTKEPSSTERWRRRGGEANSRGQYDESLKLNMCVYYTVQYSTSMLYNVWQLEDLTKDFLDSF